MIHHETKRGCANLCTTAKRNAENCKVSKAERNAVAAGIPQPANATPERERWILYDRVHSRIEREYRVYSGQLNHRGTCKVCGDTFRSFSPLARYCSRRCANDAAIEARKVARVTRRAAGAVCSCGAVIEAGPTGRIPRHCSAACRQRAYRQRQRQHE